MAGSERLRDTGELWDELTAAHRALARAHYLFSQVDNDDRRARLSQELRVGDRPVALIYLAAFSDDAYELLPDLLWLVVSHAWAGDVQNVIGRIPREKLLPRLAELVPPLLDQADGDADGYDDYAGHATLLENVGAWDLLHQLTTRALASPAPDIQEVGKTFVDEYGPLWGDKS